MTVLPPFGWLVSAIAVQVSADGHHDKNEIMFDSRICEQRIL